MCYNKRHNEQDQQKNALFFVRYYEIDRVCLKKRDDLHLYIKESLKGVEICFLTNIK